MKNSYLVVLTVISAITLIACAPKIDPIEISGCVDGEQFAKFREFCTGEKPATGNEPADGQFDPAKCSETYLTTRCDSPAAVQMDMAIYAGQ